MTTMMPKMLLGPIFSLSKAHAAKVARTIWERKTMLTKAGCKNLSAVMYANWANVVQNNT